MSQVLGPVGGAMVWTSATPYLAPRMTKARGKNTIEAQIRRELEWMTKYVLGGAAKTTTSQQQ